MNLSRRTVLAGAGAAAVAAGGTGLASSASAQTAPRFSLGYAPHEGSFASRGNRLEQIAYAADQGFTAGLFTASAMAKPCGMVCRKTPG